MPFRAANAVHVSPLMAAAYLLHFGDIPDCVGPGAATTEVLDFVVEVLVGFEVVVAAAAEAPTQYHSFAHRDVPQFWPVLPKTAFQLYNCAIKMLFREANTLQVSPDCA